MALLTMYLGCVLNGETRRTEVEARLIHEPNPLQRVVGLRNFETPKLAEQVAPAETFFFGWLQLGSMPGRSARQSALVENCWLPLPKQTDNDSYHTTDTFWFWFWIYVK